MQIYCAMPLSVNFIPSAKMTVACARRMQQRGALAGIVTVKGTQFLPSVIGAGGARAHTPKCDRKRSP